jgi:2-succinyl-5-enolpyruvyl-6-hydroxy-3-cyclohexene-1-carboxylate synthase
MNFKTLNELSTTLFIEELARQGVTDAFIAPGSRSTPLVLACENNSKIKVHVHFDERGLGFFALGFAKKTLKPVLIITTSGTAVANLLPAVVEAHYSHTPLIVCSADRPFELINVGANQAITQKDIFQNFTCDNFQIPPVCERTPMESIVTLASHSVFRATTQKCPVHVNWMFQEPLVPLKSELDNYKIDKKIENWLLSQKPYSEISHSLKVSTHLDLKELLKNKKVLVVLGSLINETQTDALLKTVTSLNAPVFCDVQNPLRFMDFPQNILRFDLLMDLTAVEQPEAILHIGGPLTSKRLNQFLESFEGEYFQVHDFEKRMDFMHLRKKILNVSVEDLSIKVSEENWDLDSLYLDTLKAHSKKLEPLLAKEFIELSEMSLPYHLVANMKFSNCFVGSSMPIRDLERFAGLSPTNDFVFNRGASGIDGNIATAAGSALASEEKTVCVLGDQAFLYDMNSLALVKQLEKPFHTVVINNQGGGIFSFLPVSQVDKTTFTKNFSHPHEWNLKSAAEMFHLKYSFVKTPSELLKALNANESSVIEIKTDIDQNVKAHRELTQKLKKYYE